VDPVAYASGALLLVGVGLFAAYVPARRASRIEPMAAITR
jgi:ABC-type antimicrobial peptide transport system permease subunit